MGDDGVGEVGEGVMLLAAGRGHGEDLGHEAVPAALSAPKQPLRHKTAECNARSVALLVGSTPSTVANVHEVGFSAVTS